MFLPHDWRCVAMRKPLVDAIVRGEKKVLACSYRPDRDDFPIAIVDSNSKTVRASAWMSASVDGGLCKGLSKIERYFGTYRRGMWAWFLIDIFPIAEPFDIAIHDKLWTPPYSVALRLQAHHWAALRTQDHDRTQRSAAERPARETRTGD
jgi:hypothetical protein